MIAKLLKKGRARKCTLSFCQIIIINKTCHSGANVRTASGAALLGHFGEPRVMHVCLGHFV